MPLVHRPHFESNGARLRRGSAEKGKNGNHGENREGRTRSRESWSDGAPVASPRLHGLPCRVSWGRDLCGPRIGYNGVLWFSLIPSCSREGLECTGPRPICTEEEEVQGLVSSSHLLAGGSVKDGSPALAGSGP